MGDLMQALERRTRDKEILPYAQVRKVLLRQMSDSLERKVLKALDGFREILGNELDDYQKLCLLYQMICEGGTYDYSKPRKSLSYSFLGALKGLAVCAGFAELFMLLAGEFTETYTPYKINGYVAQDIRSVSPNADGHAWVVIRDSNGNAWHFDPTWDLGKKEYRYFFKTDADMSGRIWATKYVPACKVKFSRKMYTNKKKLAQLVDYYKSMPQRFESGDFSVQ